MLGQDFAEGVPEVLDAVGINDGVNCGVGMGQKNRHIHDEWRSVQVFVKQLEAVEDVDGQPAEGKQSHDDGERLGGADLLLQQPMMVAVPVSDTLELDLPQLLPGHSEDLHVDAQHDEQRQQHTHKEIEVDHVVHVHHTLKEAPELAALQ